MSEITANWITVGSRTVERTEVYGSSWSHLLEGCQHFVPAPFGGPLLLVKDRMVHITNAAGHPIDMWAWKNSKIATCGWTNEENPIFVMEDGTVFVYDLFGTLVKVFGMGQEAKDLKIIDAKVFSTSTTTGVAVLTTTNRFFVVNNVKDPRVRKMFDVDWNMRLGNIVWNVLTDQKHARIVAAQTAAMVRVLTPADTFSVPAGFLPSDEDKIGHIRPSFDSSRIAICSKSGNLWFGTLDNKILSMTLDGNPDVIIWSANDTLLVFSGSMCKIIVDHGDAEDTYCPDFVTGVQEIDCTRVFCLGTQEIFRDVPSALLSTFDLRIQDSPSAHLRFAYEEFSNKSYKADEYLRQIGNNIDMAVNACVESAGHIFDPQLQKMLLGSARLGKSFILTSPMSSVEKFHKTCLALRILNSLRITKVGIPMTMCQYSFLTPRVIVDRLVLRRLYPLALKVCDLLRIPANDGANRVLVHWACHKIGKSSTEGDYAVAKMITNRLGNHPQLSDIAFKAVECGKKELAVKLLEHETRIHKQVPLLLKLGEAKKALEKALRSGNRDLAYSVILRLRDTYPSSDFYAMLRKSRQATVLYEIFCKQNERESLEDWYIQEDNYVSQAKLKFEQSFEANGLETRMARLINVSEDWQKARVEPYQALTDEYQKLLKHQQVMEDKLGKSFVGMTANDTLHQLFLLNEQKLAEKIKSDLKVSDKRFQWCKLKAIIMLRQWTEVKKYAKQKKHPVPMIQVIHMVKDIAGEEEAREFLTDEFLTNTKERIDLYSEFGMFLEAANAAFMAKSVESLNYLESICLGREDILKSIASFKNRLL